MFVKSIENLNKVMNSNLCNRCGSCVGLSDGAIVFEDKTGKYVPVQKRKINDDLADKLWQSCSGKEFNFPVYSKKIFRETPGFHRYTGAFQKIYIGYCTDEAIRRNSASGGIISSVLIWLLENKWIDGAVVLKMSETEPWMNEPFIATSKEEILISAQSKYTISSVNEILPEILRFKGNLAYVGLPGQVQSIRKLQEINDPSVINIKYIFGPFYGNTLHFSSVISFLRSYKIRDYHQVARLYFRYGEWPGYMRAEMKDGKIIQLPKFHANYLIPFHILKNSLLCTDLSNEFTDISGGDAWAPIYEERGKGFSMVISRSKTGQEIIDNMKSEGLLTLNEIELDQAIEMHSHGYDLKKRGTFIRMRFRQWLGKDNPDYGYSITGFSFTRYLMEFFIGALFLLLGTAPARFIVEKIPPAFIGNIFEKVRTFWKKSTHNIKRNQLT
jgi:coenzyme F420 hydrogenase subunit beta